MKSLFRHFMQLWKLHRGLTAEDEKGKAVTMPEALCATMFNVMGYLFEYCRDRASRIDSEANSRYDGSLALSK